MNVKKGEEQMTCPIDVFYDYIYDNEYPYSSFTAFVITGAAGRGRPYEEAKNLARLTFAEIRALMLTQKFTCE